MDEFNGFINRLIDSEFTKFNVGYPVTYLPTMTFFNTAEKLLDWYQANKDQYLITMQQKIKLGDISLTTVHYQLYFNQDPKRSSNAIKCHQDRFPDCIEQDSTLKSWTPLLN